MDEGYTTFSSYYQDTGHCFLHGQFVGWACPVCSTGVKPAQPPTVTVSPGSTEDAIAAMVRAFDSIINHLRNQVADRDREIAELRDQLDKNS